MGLAYAKVGGPPIEWRKVEVCFGGKWGGDWIEVNVAEGWGTRFVCDESGRPIRDGDDAKRETVNGAFRLRYGSNDD